MAFLQQPVVTAQDIAKVNSIARNISVKIVGYNSGQGSGFIYARQKNTYFVLTNHHVVDEYIEYEIQTYDGKKYQVTKKQEIPNLDLAIIHFESTEDYEVAELGDSDELYLQQSISVAGFPRKENDIDIVKGDIRSIRQEIIANPEQGEGYALIYTNPTLSGHSGGAVLDGQGRVIAIHGKADIDNHITRRDFSLGIPINIFLVAAQALPDTEANSSEPLVSDDSSEWELIRTLSDHSGKVSSVAVSRNKIVSGSYDETIKVWNLETGELERTLSNSYSRVFSVAICGDEIISGNLDKTIRVWNLVTGKLKQSLSGHSNAVYGVAVDGDKIVSGSYDKTIKAWHMVSWY